MNTSMKPETTFKENLVAVIKDRRHNPASLTSLFNDISIADNPRFFDKQLHTEAGKVKLLTEANNDIKRPVRADLSEGNKEKNNIKKLRDATIMEIARYG